MRKLATAALAVLACLLLGAAVFMAIHVRGVLDHARQQVASEAEFPFEVRNLTQSSSVAFEEVAAPGAYTVGVAFQGKTYLGGPGGLAEFRSADESGDVSSQGKAPRLWRTGIDLPPAPVTALAAGALRGNAQPLVMAGTRGAGVLLWDGATLRQIVAKDVRARDVTAILPLASGDLLVGTRTLGVLVFDGGRLRPFHPSLSGIAVTSLAGSEGDVWVGTRNRGVLHWRAGEVESFAEGLPDLQVESIVVRGGKAYVGTPLGVAEFDGGRLARVLAKDFFAHALAVDRDTLLIGSVDQGVREISLSGRGFPREGRIEPVTFGGAVTARGAPLQVESFVAGDAMLAITKDGTFRRSRGGEWRAVLPAASSLLADRNISALEFGSDGRLWIGYFDHGLDVLSLEKAGERARHVEDDHVFCVNRIMPDAKRHTMDVATANGLVLFNEAGGEAGGDSGRARQTLLRRDGLIADQVTDVAFTADGMAVATPAGITFSSARGMESLYAFQGLVNNHVYALANDESTGTLMAGTLGGISVLRGQAVLRNLSMRNSGLKQNWITAIVLLGGQGEVDGQAKWLIGTYGAGVMEMDGDGHVSAMESPAPSAVINPHAMLVTPRYVLAGSLSDGLLVYSRAGHTWRQVTGGLPSLNVTALAERDGVLYVGTDNGLVKMRDGGLDE